MPWYSWKLHSSYLKLDGNLHLVIREFSSATVEKADSKNPSEIIFF
jgi:hypothetical protein